MIAGAGPALAALLASSAPAVAQQPAQARPQGEVKKASDPNEIVCEKQHDTGSRLMMHKVCMTRSQWSEQRRLDRQDIEKVQVLRPMAN
jgi:invasion protein IalB